MLREPGKSAEAISYLWIYRTGRSLLRFSTTSRRTGATRSAELLSGFTSYLNVEGYSGHY
ncbi:Transposase IS66 family protein [Paenibacillus sp. UNCCL117]|uniref:transposase n=1 Tax=unclassified Paenibacillus TaxID=185978 RepID=UPI00088B03F2|nr:MULTISPECIES: transposase [unclassified Paenibacillus]SDE64326.1 Transposase IS66 family protein [Paenibacillus sp. cl123]SFW70575.1 Transposase IS66 family protein [Paenibacillus sp. UNCCL117]